MQGRVISTTDNNLVVVEVLNGTLKSGDIIKISKGKTRSISQNSLYWKFLSWLVEEGGLKDQGHFDPMGLHLSLKAHFLAEKAMTQGEFKEIEEATTTTLTTKEFSDYMERVDMFVCDFFSISTAVFWEEHEQNYGG